MIDYIIAVNDSYHNFIERMCINIVDNDQINEKSICLIIYAGRLATSNVATAMGHFLDYSKNKDKNTPASNHFAIKGNQSVRQLIGGNGGGIKNIDISKASIKPFESVARKHGVDFTIKKDSTAHPAKWLLFFKGRDSRAIPAAFKEYSENAKEKNSSKLSLIAALRNLMEKVKNQVIDQTKYKDRGRDL